MLDPHRYMYCINIGNTFQKKKKKKIVRVGAMDVEIIAARYSARRQSKRGYSVAATGADPT